MLAFSRAPGHWTPRGGAPMITSGGSRGSRLRAGGDRRMGTKAAEGSR